MGCDSTIALRPVLASDLPALSALCLRSKAHWGYDAAFMAACVDELTLTESDLSALSLCMAEENAIPLGMVGVTRSGDPAELHSLFIDPPAIGRGLGKRLFLWAEAQARAQKATALRLDADPFAEPFYRAMGLQVIGQTPSGSIPGRVLPLMEKRLSA